VVWWHWAIGILMGGLLLPIVSRWAHLSPVLACARCVHCCAAKYLILVRSAVLDRLVRGSIDYKGKHVVISGGSSGYAFPPPSTCFLPTLPWAANSGSVRPGVYVLNMVMLSGQHRTGNRQGICQAWQVTSPNYRLTIASHPTPCSSARCEPEVCWYCSNVFSVLSRLTCMNGYSHVTIVARTVSKLKYAILLSLLFGFHIYVCSRVRDSAWLCSVCCP